MAVLSIKGLIKVPIYMSSRYVFLYGKDGKCITRVVEIRAELDKPLELTPSRYNLDNVLEYTIEEIEKGKKFQIRFTILLSSAKTFSGFLKLKTNYNEKPEITIWIRGRFRKKG